MNACVLILGSFFLQLDNGYNDVKFVKVEDITIISGSGKSLIFTPNHLTNTGWIPEKDRYMTATETVELIKSCDNVYH